MSVAIFSMHAPALNSDKYLGTYMTNNWAMFACGPVFGLDVVILIMAWMASAGIFLVNLCLIPFRPARSILRQALLAGGCAGAAFVIVNNLTIHPHNWITTLLYIAACAVPVAVISQLVFLIAEMVRARRRKQATEIVPGPSTAAKPA
jgi:hypothetical protein